MLQLTIGQLAKQAGVGVETIRYYERRGLMAKPGRRASGYRQYDETAIARIAFIRRCKDLGFTLTEIKELLGLWFDTQTTCTEVRRKAEQKIDDIESRIKTLQAMKRSLRKVVDQCHQRKSLQECPLLDGLPTPTTRTGR